MRCMGEADGFRCFMNKYVQPRYHLVDLDGLHRMTVILSVACFSYLNFVYDICARARSGHQ